MKQAQVAVFIFVGILVVLAVGFFGVLALQGTTQLPASTKGAQQFVNLCFGETAACMVYRIGTTAEPVIPGLDGLHDAGIEYYSPTARSCLKSNHVSHDLIVNTLVPEVLLEEKTTAKVAGDIRVRENKAETLLEGYKETFDVPFKEMYTEAVELKAGDKPAGVPESYIRLDSVFDVDVGEKDGKKFISIAGGELKKQYYRFNVVK
ncbi:MAG: hypothetical protein Q7R76_01050 [Candidatus Woesearchaeota archaeon]|nr:hypothetical protein [Candidatus Woesearchaeota archaeon]